MTATALLRGQPRALPAGGFAVVSVADTVRAAVVWNGQRGGALRVPVAALGAGAVRVETQNCGDAPGPVQVGVRADAPWSPTGGIAGSAVVTIRAGGDPPTCKANSCEHLIVTIRTPVVRHGGSSRVFVGIVEGVTEPAPGDLMRIDLSPAIRGRFEVRSGGQVHRVPPGGSITWSQGGDIWVVLDGARPPGDEQVTVSATMQTTAGLSGSSQITLEAPPIELRLLGQDDRPVSPSGAGEHVLHSRFATNDDLPPFVGFLSGVSDAELDPFQDQNAGDVYAMRPEVLGLAAGQQVVFELSVGSVSETYAAVEGVVPATSVIAYRGVHPFRLVAHSVDDDYRPCGSSCSGGEPDQTLLAAVGDDLVVTARDRASGQALAEEAYRVGWGMSRAGNVYEPLEAVLNWRWAAGSPKPDDATALASQTYAQAAVTLRPRLSGGAIDEAWGAFDERDIKNVLHVSCSRRQRCEPGTVQITGERRGVLWSVTFENTAEVALQDLVQSLRTQLTSELSVDVTAHPGDVQSEKSATFSSSDESESWRIVIGRSREVSGVEVRGANKRSLNITRVDVRTRDLTLDVFASVIHAVRDADPTTVDLLVVPSRAMRIQGQGGQRGNEDIRGKGVEIFEGLPDIEP